MTDIIDITQLVGKSEAADILGMSIQNFNHHLKRDDAPKPFLIGSNKRPYYKRSDITNWELPRKPRKR